MTTRVFEQQISCIQFSYLTHRAIRRNSLCRFGVLEFTVLSQKQLVFIEILQFWAKFESCMASCSRFLKDHKLHWPRENLNCELVTYKFLLMMWSGSALLYNNFSDKEKIIYQKRVSTAIGSSSEVYLRELLLYDLLGISYWFGQQRFLKNTYL